MSLTSELHRPDSPISRFFAKNFPARDDFWSAWIERVWKYNALRPEGSLANYPWALVGAALDYRIRVHWRPYAAGETVAALGGRYARRFGMPDAAEMWPDLSARWDLMMAYIKRGNDLDPGRQDALARMCVIMAAYEAIARSRREDRLLFGATAIDQALDRVPAQVINDISTLLTEFQRSHERFLHPQSIVLNPVFTGSQLVGGADGDVILDQLLWDFKTTIHPTRENNDYWPYQILGYGLLDLDDTYRLKGAGIYLSRQGLWVSWTWDKMLNLLGAKPGVTMQEWRSGLIDALLRSA